MKTEEEKDEQLIRWLEGDLSGQELSIFESSSEFKDYKKIVDGVDDMTYPIMDQATVFANIKNEITTKTSQKPKTAKVIPIKKWILAVASIAILALATLIILPSSVKVNSGVGQFVSHSLPDGSEINLNGNSQIDYKENFENDRTLQLRGEAFFNVKKGKSFTVETKQGLVSVLGTSFNIFSRGQTFVVSCKTGKVKVESNNQSYILNKGDRVRIENNRSLGKENIDIGKIGSWINGESYFAGASLGEVVLSLSSIYDTQIDLPPIYKNKKFTGSFIHNDLKKALKMVFSPMEIPYSLDDQGKVVLSD